jgi:hypothetical protein
MEEKVQDYPDLVKVDKAFIVNVNEQKYRAALLRKQTNKKLGTLEERVAGLEANIQTILDILQGKNSTETT